MPRYSTCHRDMLGRVMGRLDAVIALVESLPDKCAKQYWRARVTPVALEWHILAADAGLVDFGPLPCPEKATGGRAGVGPGWLIAGIAGGLVAGAALATLHADTFEVRSSRRLDEIVAEIDAKETLDARARAALMDYRRRRGLSWAPDWLSGFGWFTVRVLTALGIITGAVVAGRAVKGRMQKVKG